MITSLHGLLRRLRPFIQLQAGRHVVPVQTDDALGCAGGAAARQDHGAIVRADVDRRPSFQSMRANQLLQPQVALLERDAMAFTLLLGQREQPPQDRRQILLDRGGDDSLHARPPLHFLDAGIEQRERDDGLRLRRRQHLLELTLAVRGIQRRRRRRRTSRCRTRRRGTAGNWEE
jgi:hypothetical protein